MGGRLQYEVTNLDNPNYKHLDHESIMNIPEEIDIALVYESHRYKSKGMVPLKIC